MTSLGKYRPRMTETVEMPFMKKSSEPSLSEELTIDLQIKYARVLNHLQNMKDYLWAHKVNGVVESAKHGRISFNTKSPDKKMTSVKYAALMKEIHDMEYECSRLQSLINA